MYGGYNEIVAALGIEGRLIARTKADRIPESIINKPVLGTHMRPNIELTMSLKPDLILQNAGRREAMIPVDQLKKLGFQVAVFSPETFDELFSVIERIGILTGTSDRAKLLVQTMGLRLKNVQDKVSKISQKPEVFFEARYPNLLAAGQSSIVNDIIRYAGGNNCVSVQKKFVRVNEESLLSWDPDFYLIQIGPMNRNPVKLKDRAHYKKLRVVSEKKYLEVDEQIFSRPGPRSIEAVEKLSQFIFPHLWGMN
ncbi:MAG: ABC transporter substrate-binding protein [Syntrophaceae bacterium]|nr:ABC transporter substrate-binding protein [Syntrophaceae bacterium]